MDWRKKGNSFDVIGLALLVFLSILSLCAGVAVMSVDLGSEWMKVAIVSPGVPMEIALNRESKRKTPVAISFRDNEREIGDAALGVGVRFPDATYTHILQLLGKKVDNPVVKLYQERFPYHKIVADPHTGTVIFEKDSESSFKVEELLSMILNRAREYAEEFANQLIKDVVITVPVYFNQAERNAVMQAATLANLKVLQLINSNTAVALNYGVFRRKDFNTTAQNIMFYDMGATSTTATIVSYQLVKTKERGFVETNPQLTIVGVGFDRTLGGQEFTLRLREHLAKLFNDQKKTKQDVFKNFRAMSKLLKEAERVKMILSANTEHFAQVENLLDDKDFRSAITRDDFESLCRDLFDRVGNPVQKALKSAAMTMDNIDQVILVGAGTRIPKVQEKLLEAVNKPDLGKNLNTDEAAAMGAVYQAAHLSQGFKVKKFLVKDAVLYPIQVDFEREIDADRKKLVSRTLFGVISPYPLKKVITFNRITKDPFIFHVNYGKFELPIGDPAVFGSLNISKVQLTGIKDALDKHQDDETEPKGVKAHFRMDESGILVLDLVESLFEKIEEVPAEADSDSESAFSKFGNTISKLFSGGGEEKGKTEEKETSEKSEPAEEIKAEAADDKQQDPTSQPINVTEQANVTLNGTETTNQTSAKNDSKPILKPKVVTIKESLIFQQEKLDIVDPFETDVKISIKKIDDFNKRELEQKAKEEAKNNLESFILDTQDKLYQSEYEAASTDSEREIIRTRLSEASEWLYEEEAIDDAKVYKDKLSSLNAVTKDLFGRVKEHRERPEILKAMSELINMSEVFLSKVRELPEDEQYFTEVELQLLDKTINDTKEWVAAKLKEQTAIPLTEKPIMTVRSIAEKMAILDREVKYLVNKARTSKPKPKKPKANDTTANNTTEESTTATDETPTKTTNAPDEEQTEEKSIQDTPPTEETTTEPPPRSEL